jgi:hypothetical protein
MRAGLHGQPARPQLRAVAAPTWLLHDELCVNGLVRLQAHYQLVAHALGIAAE